MKLASQHTYQPPKTGLWLLQALIVLLFIILCSRFWYLQILKGEQYALLAEANKTRTEKILATRGMIFDRNYIKLAQNIITFDVSLTREDCPDVMSTLFSLATVLGIDEGILQENFEQYSKGKSIYTPIPVLKGIAFEDVAKIESRTLFLPGISIQTALRRDYPTGSSFAHILGYVAEANQTDISSNSQIALGDVVGRQGLELEFEDILRGTKGEYKNQHDVLGRVVERELQQEPLSGQNLVLSLDIDLQDKITEIMGDYAGSTIVMEPHSGHILAMVTLPTYDNNLFVRGLTHEQWENLSTDIRHPLQNRAIQSTYPPASVWKILMSALILSEGIDPKKTVYCPGEIKIGNRTFRCWRRGGHGHVDMEKALMQSCDVYFYEMSNNIGIDKISEFAYASGFGVPTGIDLPSERGGLVPTREWKLKRYGEPWQRGETINVSIGQGQVLVTPLQIATYISSLLNDGSILKPQILFSAQKEVHLKSPSTDKERALLKSYMELTAKSGTAKVLAQKNPEIIVGGKTGTAQVVKLQMEGDRRLTTEEMEYFERDHAWITGFAQYKGKDVVIVTMLEHAGGGSSMAGPIAYEVLHYIYKDENKEFEDEE